jgi:hypothetical protein
VSVVVLARAPVRKGGGTTFKTVFRSARRKLASGLKKRRKMKVAEKSGKIGEPHTPPPQKRRREGNWTAIQGMKERGEKKMHRYLL